MNKFLVITTINKPTEAIEKFISRNDWQIIIVGDQKTPRNYYNNISNNVFYMSPEIQDKKYPEYSRSLGWNTSCRRNVGFIEAYNRGCDILAMADDDNIPYDNWGEEIIVSQEITCTLFKSKSLLPIFDPLYIVDKDHLWFRGYPLEYVKARDFELTGKDMVVPKVQVNLWNGNPDIDAIGRFIFAPEVKYNFEGYLKGDGFKYSIFNSQNTILHRSVIPYYMLLPFIGRVDDIWGSFLMQSLLDVPVVYGPPTVYQDRNEHSIINDFIQEVYGTSNVYNFVNSNDLLNSLPVKTKECFEIYRKQFNK
jgi:hypothetical protein